jgi:SWI/SNF-related matrix-associated actin-dependent regulator 1 of chromatin subfamily A
VIPDFAYNSSFALEPSFYEAPVPPNQEARAYQHGGVEYSIVRDNSLIADEPGVGKTPQGVMISNAVEAKRTLVIPPSSIVLNWEREVWRWSTIPNVKTYPVLKSSDGISSEAHFVIVPYALAIKPAIFAAIMDLRWDHVVLDEAHFLKDPKGNMRTKAICGWNDRGTYRPGIIDVCGRKTLLSGTPMPNGRPDEVYNSIRMLDHSVIDFASLEAFREHYYGMGEGFVFSPVEKRKEVNGVWQTYTVRERHWSDSVRNVPRFLDDLHLKLRRGIMVRRLKKDVLSQLPPKQWVPIAIPLSGDVKKAFAHPGWSAAERLYDMDPDKFYGAAIVDGSISEARRVLGEAKAPTVAAYIEDLLAEGRQKLIVGAHHKSVLSYLRERLKDYGVCYMDGSTSPRQKQAEVDRFNADDRYRVMLGQKQPLGLGWTLVVAQDAVDAEPDWVPGVNDQFLDRLHRFGQKGSVTGHMAIVPGTLDERIVGSSIAKDQHSFEALDRRL